MDRIYFLVANIAEAEAVVADVRQLGFDDERIHVLAEGRNLAQSDLPEAGLLESSDVVNAAQKGATAGATMGLAGGLALVAFPPAGAAIGAGAVLATTALGTALGTWMSTMIGVSVDNEDLDHLQACVDAGQVLVLLDVEDDQDEEVRAAVRRRNPGIVVKQGVLN